MRSIDYLWRLFSTTLGFALFGIAGLVMGLVLFPLMFVFIRESARRKVIARNMIGWAFGAFVWLMKATGIMGCQISGAENIKCRPGQLIVANHPTLIDVVILISLFPQANCVIKSAVTRNIFMRSTVLAADYISNNDPVELLQACENYLRSGGSLLLFPEGTRTKEGQPIEFKPGAATVATRSDADILPIVIDCTPIFLSRQRPWYHVPGDHPQFTIRVLSPRPMREMVEADDTERHNRLQLNDAILHLINDELADIRKPAEVPCDFVAETGSKPG